MTDSIFYPFYAIILSIPLGLYLFRQKRREAKAREAAARGELYSEGPRGQHPHINVTNCIGCQGCTSVCPEGSVLGMIGAKAAVIQPHKCIGHGMCAEACPVGAITMRHATAGISSDLPFLNQEHETTVPNLFIAGELGGLALIRNAVRQGRECMDTVASRGLRGGDYDVIIIGAGPAGISAALRAIEHGLRYVLIERDGIGGTVTKYPRQKLVMTSPIDFPIYGRLKELKLSKEFLMGFWEKIAARPDFNARLNEPVENIEPTTEGFFVRTSLSSYRSAAVILAIGRGGTPRKLGVPGEELPKVMYRLIEAEHYRNKRIVVVGGGDSAVEAAIGLSIQPGNEVILSYRKKEFMRIKERNAQRLREGQQKGAIKVILNSNPLRFTESTVALDIDGEVREFDNDYVWIFAGGVAPNDFLKKIGVGFGPQDLTAETVREARRQPAEAAPIPVLTA